MQKVGVTHTMQTITITCSYIISTQMLALCFIHNKVYKEPVIVRNFLLLPNHYHFHAYMKKSTITIQENANTDSTC